VFDHRGVLAGSNAIVGSTQFIASKPVTAQLGAAQEASSVCLANFAKWMT